MRNSPKDSPKDSPKELAFEIVGVLTVEPGLSLRAVADKLGVARYQVRYQIEKLREQGVVQHIGTKSTGQWRVNEQVLTKQE